MQDPQYDILTAGGPGDDLPVFKKRKAVTSNEVDDLPVFKKKIDGSVSASIGGGATSALADGGAQPSQSASTSPLPLSNDPIRNSLNFMSQFVEQNVHEDEAKKSDILNGNGDALAAFSKEQKQRIKNTIGVYDREVAAFYQESTNRLGDMSGGVRRDLIDQVKQKVGFAADAELDRPAFVGLDTYEESRLKKAAIVKEKQDFQANVFPLASLVADKNVVNKTPKEMGRRVRQLIGDEEVDTEIRWEDKGIELRPDQKALNDLTGLNAMEVAVAAKINAITPETPKHLVDEVLAEEKKVNDLRKGQLREHKEFYQGQIAKLIGEEIYKEKNPFQIATGLYNITDEDIQRIGTRLGFSSEELAGIKDADIPNESVAGRLYYNFIAKPASEIDNLDNIVSGWLGRDKDVVLSQIQRRSIAIDKDYAIPDAQALRRDGLKIEADRESNRFLTTVASDESQKYNTAFIPMLTTAADVFGQMVGFYTFGAGAGGGTLKALKIVKNADRAAAIGNFTYTTASTFPENYRQASLYTDDQAIINGTAAIKSIFTAATEQLILPDYKIINKVLGGTKLSANQLVDYVSKTGIENITKEGLKGYLKSGAQGIANVAKEISEEELDLFFDFGVNAVALPSSNEGRDLGDEIINTAIVTAIGSALPIGIAELRAQRGMDKQKEDLTFHIGHNAGAFISQIQKSAADGEIDQAVANKKIQVVNTMAKAVELSRDVPVKQQKRYAHNLLQTALLKEEIQNAATDEARVELLNAELQGLINERKQILTPPAPVATTQTAPVETAMATSTETTDQFELARKAAQTDMQPIYRESFSSDVETGLKEAAQQLNASDNEAQNARIFYGNTISNIALKLYPKETASAPPQADNSVVDKNFTIENVNELKKLSDADGKEYIEETIEPRIKNIERNEKNVENIKKALSENKQTDNNSVLPYEYSDLLNNMREQFGLPKIENIRELSVDELLDHLNENIKGLENEKQETNKLIKNAANNLQKTGRLNSEQPPSNKQPQPTVKGEGSGVGGGVSDTPIRNAYVNRVDDLDEETKQSDVSKLEVGDYANVPRTNESSGVTGFVKKIGRTNVVLDTFYQLGATGDEGVMQEITVKKSDIAEYIKPKKETQTENIPNTNKTEKNGNQEKSGQESRKKSSEESSEENNQKGRSQKEGGSKKDSDQKTGSKKDSDKKQTGQESPTETTSTTSTGNRGGVVPRGSEATGSESTGGTVEGTAGGTTEAGTTTDTGAGRTSGRDGDTGNDAKQGSGQGRGDSDITESDTATGAAIIKESAQTVKVGDLVKFTEPAIVYENGKPKIIQSVKAGTVVSVKDGNIEVRPQQGGYRMLSADEIISDKKAQDENEINKASIVAAIESQTEIAEREAADAEDSGDQQKANEVIEHVDTQIAVIDEIVGGTPEQQARDAGQKVVDGAVVKRQNPIKAIFGKAVDVLFAKNERQPARYAVIERADLQPSHKNGIKNEKHFIPEAQPRDRGGLQVLKNAAKEKSDNLVPSDLAENNVAYYGSPIVNERGEVIQGNGRAEAIDYYYNNDKGDSKGYRQMILAKAKDLGIDVTDVEKMKEPVLVRLSEVEDGRAIVLGNYESSHLEDVKQRNATAKAALGRMKPSDFVELSNMIGVSETQTLKGVIRDNAKKILDKLMDIGVLRADNKEQYFSETGVTEEGINAATNIVKQMLFEGGSNDLQTKFDNLSNAQVTAIELTIPAILGTAGLKSHVQKAIEILHDKAESGIQNFDSWLKQTDMFTGKTPAESYSKADLALAKKIHDAPNQKAITTLVKQIARDMSGTPANMFDPEIKGKSFNAAIGVAEDAKTETRQSKEAPPTEQKTKKEITRDDLEADLEDFLGGIPSVSKSESSGKEVPADIKKYEDTAFVLKEARKQFKNNPTLIRIIDVLEAALAANPQIKIDTTKALGKQFDGMSYPDGSIAINFSNFRGEGPLLRTMLHEFIHGVTRNEINTNSAFRDQLGEILSAIRKDLKIPDNNTIASALYKRGILNEDLYGVSNEHELLAELFTNDKFREYVKSIPYQKDNLLKRFFAKIAAFFSDKYKAVVAAQESGVNNLADYLIALTENVVKRQNIKFAGGELLPSVSKTDRQIGKWVAQKLAEGVDPADISAILRKKLGIDANAAQNIIDKNSQIGITHDATDVTRDKFGLGGYDKETFTIEELDQSAAQAIRDGYNIEELLRRLESGGIPNSVETRILLKYKSNLEAKIENDPSDENLTTLKRLVQASDTARSDIGRSLRVGQGFIAKDETLGDYFVTEMEVSGVEFLTDEQKQGVISEFNELKAANEKLKTALDELHEANANKKAAKNVDAGKIYKKPKKTHEDFVKERDGYREELRKAKEKQEQFLKDKGIQKQGFGLTLTGDMAKAILKIVKSHLDENVSKLEDVISKVYEDIRDIFPDATKEDIRDVIAGEYSQPKTRSELAAQMNDLREEAKLLNKLANLEAGNVPKNTNKKVERNREITGLRNRINAINYRIRQEEKDENKSYDDLLPRKASQLVSLKNRFEREAEKIKKDIQDGNFSQKEKPTPILEDRLLRQQFPELHKAAVEAKDKLIKVKLDREVRLMQEEYANRTKLQKIKDFGAEILNVPRTLMSSMDFSAPLRQAVIITISHPQLAGKAFVEMFRQSVSQKRFDRWFYDVRQDPDFAIMEKSGLYIADPHDKRLAAKEEAFMNNLAEKIPLIGIMVKGSERAYVSYLNKMRYDLFKQGEAVLLTKGKTLENAERDYKALASWVNNATGRGKMIDQLERASPILNATFFSPRLIASRLNLLNPLYYAKLPPDVRKMALGDMAKFITFGMSVLALAHYASPDDDEGDKIIQIEYDPRSTDFGKIKVGNTRYDIWGGFQQYIRFFAQFFSGRTKTTTTGKIKKLDGKGQFGQDRGDVIGRFVRTKLAPVTATITDIVTGETIMGDRIVYQLGGKVGKKEITITDEVKKILMPLVVSDVAEAIKKEGIKSLGTIWLPATFGIGVQSYDENKSDKPKERRE